eukprot:CAMPEP_0206413826 /NCGR_PEP_ID=MMETSP0294-20121207/34939_1 /ASSEMBLY_ACC=CAM_ASM_000327 /TAXON_ID=39354 /ORGANISM="Heterosigma akashiwo, Strain CCMP2393" /LENGTH=261 /DNA_ID=CAMNT_0053875477 /DNA_START=63 /DNA_END=844 /DNA_ORIENTATION=-
MNIEVPVCGPQAHLCPLYGAGVQCLTGYGDLLCAQTRRCWGNSQGRGCPALLSCALEHIRQPSACCFGGSCGLVLIGAVCGESDSRWYTSGPVRGKHFAAERRARRVHGQDLSGLVANETAIPGPVLTGGGARAKKRLGKQARERLRRRKAKEIAQSSTRRPGHARAGGPIDQVEQRTSCQEQAPPNTAAADNDTTSAAPLSCSRTSAGDGRKNQEEFCARLSMNQRIVIYESRIRRKKLGGGENSKKARSKQEQRSTNQT